MLEVRNLYGGYGDTTILRDMTLTVPDSAVVAVLGPNGAGKTTLMRTLAGLLRSFSGDILLDGSSLLKSSAHERASQGVSLIPEGRGIFASMTVRENLLMYAPKRKTAQTINRACDEFPFLRQVLRQRAGTLSGGEQQMLAVVRAYVRSARIVMIDEASQGLAPMIVDRLFTFFAEIASRGTSLLIVEQYVQRVLGLADQAYVINHGEVVFGGDSASLKETDVLARYFGDIGEMNQTQ